MRRTLAIAAGLAFLAGPLAAADTILYPHGAAGSPSGASDASGPGAATIVLAVICAGAGGWILWRNKRTASARGAQGRLSVSETKPLGNRQFLVVASYGEQKFLIGVCPGRINLLSPLDGGTRPPAQ